MSRDEMSRVIIGLAALLVGCLLLGLGVHGLMVLKQRRSRISILAEALYEAVLGIFTLLGRPLLLTLGIAVLWLMAGGVYSQRAAISQAVSEAMRRITLEEFTHWRLLGVPSTGSPVELARYAHHADCLEAREAAIRRAWTERQQLPNLECSASVGYWERLYKFLNK